MGSHTAFGNRRLARYRNVRNGYFLDLDEMWIDDAGSKRDPKRFRVYYGPGICLHYATRKEAFAFVRGFVQTEARFGPFTPSPFQGCSRPQRKVAA